MVVQLTKERIIFMVPVVVVVGGGGGGGDGGGGGGGTTAAKLGTPAGLVSKGDCTTLAGVRRANLH